MSLMWGVGLFVFSLLAFFISIMLWKASKPLWFLITIAIGLSAWIFQDRINNYMDPLFLSNVNLPAENILSGNEIMLHGWLYKARRIVLQGTQLPQSKEKAKAARQALEKLLTKDKKLAFSFPAGVGETPEPWPAQVTIDGQSLNRLMIDKKLLDESSGGSSDFPSLVTPKIPVQSKRASATPTTKLEEQQTAEPPTQDIPTWLRYVGWLLLSAFGSTSFGMVLNKRPAASLPFLAIVGASLWGIYSSWQEDISFVPPLLCLVFIFLFGGAGKSANRQYLEQRAEKKRRQGEW